MCSPLSQLPLLHNAVFPLVYFHRSLCSNHTTHHFFLSQTMELCVTLDVLGVSKVFEVDPECGVSDVKHLACEAFDLRHEHVALCIDDGNRTPLPDTARLGETSIDTDTGLVLVKTFPDVKTPYLCDYEGSMWSNCVSPCGKTAVIGTKSGVSLFCTETWAQQRRVSCDDGNVRAVFFSPSGQWLYVLSNSVVQRYAVDADYTRMSTCTVTDVADVEPCGDGIVCATHGTFYLLSWELEVRSQIEAPGSTLLACTVWLGEISKLNQLLIRDSSGGDVVRTVDSVHHAVFSRDGARLAIFSEGRVLSVQDTASGVVAFRMELHVKLNLLCFSHCGEYLLTRNTQSAVLTQREALTGNDVRSFEKCYGLVTTSPCSRFVFYENSNARGMFVYSMFPEKEDPVIE